MSARASDLHGRLALRFCAALMAAGAFFCAPLVQAGIDVSLSRELRQMEELEEIIREVEQAEDQADVQRARERWEKLQAELLDLDRRLGLLPNDIAGRRTKILADDIDRLARVLRALQKDMAQYFPKARHRVAVFAFDDPDGTGLGNSLAYLLSKHLLFSTRAKSFAVVNFQQGVAPSEPGDLGYFDKVEKLTAGQGYSFALWGRIVRTSAGIAVDVFGQAFVSWGGRKYFHDFILPEAMGGGRITAGLTMDRFKLQSLVLPESAAAQLPGIVAEITRLRDAPSTTGATVTELTQDKPYYIAASDGDWVRLQLRNGPTGWTSVRAFCNGECARLLDSVDFANGMLVAADGEGLPAAAPRLAGDTVQVRRQLAALDTLRADGAPAADTSGAGFQVAAMTNMRVVAALRAAFGDRAPGERGYDNQRLPEAFVREQVNALEAALPYNPRDRYILHNMAVLSDYLGDTERADKAVFLQSDKQALIIGNGEYSNLPQLSYAQRDVARLAETLALRGYSVHAAADANGLTMAREFRSLKDNGKDSITLVYYSGHTIVDGNDIILLPVDANPESGRGDGVSLQQWVEELAGSGARQVLLLLDIQVPEKVLERFFERMRKRGVSNVYALVQGSLLLLQRDVGAGVVPFILSEGLGGKADLDADGFVAASELETYVRDSAIRFELLEDSDTRRRMFHATGERTALFSASLTR